MNSGRGIFAAVVLGCLAGAAGQARAASAVAADVCASTPAAALARAGGAINDARVANTSAPVSMPAEASVPVPAEAHGYRVASVRWDSLQQQSWAVIASCDHPERPLVTMLMDLPLRAVPPHVILARAYAVVPVVRAGDLVRLWKIDHDAHIEMVATSEENGAVGARVRVRLATSTFGDGQVTQRMYFAGIVRGPADVEMAP